MSELQVEVLIGAVGAAEDGGLLHLHQLFHHVLGWLRRDDVDLALAEGVDCRERIGDEADDDPLESRLMGAGVSGIRREGQVVAGDEIGDGVRSGSDEQVLVPGHRGEIEAGVPEAGDLGQPGRVIRLDGLDQRILRLLVVLEPEGILCDHMGRQADTEDELPVDEEPVIAERE